MKLATINFIHELLKREVETLEAEKESFYETLVKTEEENFYKSVPDIKGYEILVKQYEKAQEAYSFALRALQEFENKDF